jgi:hypothetical protein
VQWETSFPAAFQRLDIQGGDLGGSLPGNQAKTANVRFGAAKRTILVAKLPGLCDAGVWYQDGL